MANPEEEIIVSLEKTKTPTESCRFRQGFSLLLKDILANEQLCV